MLVYYLCHSPNLVPDVFEINVCGVFLAAVRVGVALRTVAFPLAVGSGVASCAVVFQPAVGARVAHRAVAFHLAVGSRAALHAFAFQLPVRAWVAHRAVEFPLPVGAPFLAHGAPRQIPPRKTPRAALTSLTSAPRVVRPFGDLCRCERYF